MVSLVIKTFSIMVSLVIRTPIEPQISAQIDYRSNPVALLKLLSICRLFIKSLFRYVAFRY